jgi:hypothetical protein
MNLVEASLEDGVVRFGPYAVPLDPGSRPAVRGRVVLGIRPEAFEDGALAAPHLPRIAVHVDVLEELGADTHACFRVEAPRPDVEIGVRRTRRRSWRRTPRSSRRDSTRRRAPGRAMPSSSPSTRGVPLLRRRDGRAADAARDEPSARAAPAGAGEWS